MLGATGVLYNGVKEDGSLCKLETLPGSPSRVDGYSIKISERTGTKAGSVIDTAEINKNSTVLYEKIDQNQKSGSGNVRTFQHWVVSSPSGDFEIEQCTYVGLRDFDFAVIKNGVRVSCNVHFGPL